VSRYFYPLAWLSGLIFIDQATKVFVPGGWVNSAANGLFLMGGIITILLLALLFLPAWSVRLLTTNYSLLTLLAGGVSNLLDRVALGGVRDLFQMGSLAFNLADVYVVVGAAGVLYLAAAGRHRVHLGLY